MKNKKIKKMINILVICLYFIWPYFLICITNLLKLSEMHDLCVSSLLNFVFLFIVIYIYKDVLFNYYSNAKINFKFNILNGLKIFAIGLVVYLLFNGLFEIIDVPILSNQDSMVAMFEKIPIMFVLNTLFYYPIIEEIVFKMSLKEILKNKWSFVIITGLLNAFFQIIFSMNNFIDLIYLVPYAVFFGSLSYVYYRTDNIMYPILLRVCYNLIPCIIYLVDLLY